MGAVLAGGGVTSQIAKLPHRSIKSTTSEAGTGGHIKANLHRLDLIDRRTMAAGQESIDTVAGWCERQRMGPLFRCYTPDDLHGCGVEYVDYTGISNGHVQMLVLPIEEDDIGSAAQLLPAYDLSRCRFERDQCALITGAEQTMRGEIQIETMRTSRGNWKCACDGSGPLRIDGNNLGRIGDIHEKNLSIRIVDRPTALAGNSNLVLHDALVEIDHRQCVGACQCAASPTFATRTSRWRCA